MLNKPSFLSLHFYMVFIRISFTQLWVFKLQHVTAASSTNNYHFCFCKNHGYVNIRLQQTPFIALSAYSLNMVLLHHLVYYLIGLASWPKTLWGIQQFIFGSLYTLLFLIAIMFVLRKNKQ